MSIPIRFGVALVCGFLLSIPPAAAAEEKQFTLKLGGKFCEFYPDNIKQALTELSGVKAVDLNSKKGHAIVTVDPSKTKPKELTAAVNKVKGEGWHCTAEVMK